MANMATQNVTTSILLRRGDEHPASGGARRRPTSGGLELRQRAAEPAALQDRRSVVDKCNRSQRRNETVDGTEDDERGQCRWCRQEWRHCVGRPQYAIDRPGLTPDL